MGTVEQTLAGHRTLRKYVLPGERVVLTRRSHWGKLLEPTVTTVAGFVAVAWLVDAAGGVVGDRSTWLWWLWLALVARLAWRVVDWRNEWFVATDKRMLLLYGLVTHKVSMMPLVKVTDMRYSRSIAGRLLGYGEFTLESAGQDQALGRISWVADPDATYRELCAIIFTPSQPLHGQPPSVPVRPAVRERRAGDTQPIRIPPRRTAGHDGPGWAVSGDPGTFVPVHDPDHRSGD
ncbi:PH domain-containing protein [Cellulomonas sp. ICMP 17802]|uniref:PH domain-containing protein n=1 Tax=Cellulomonas sp. ICMP 17802 TaxID=3239199 RepID=UPI00351AF1B1